MESNKDFPMSMSCALWHAPMHWARARNKRENCPSTRTVNHRFFFFFFFFF